MSNHFFMGVLKGVGVGGVKNKKYNIGDLVMDIGIEPIFYRTLDNLVRVHYPLITASYLIHRSPKGEDFLRMLLRWLR